MTDLTGQEQAHVRAALRFLRTRSGGWEVLGRALHIAPKTLLHVSEGRPPSASLAFRLAKLAGVPVDDLIAGKYPAPGTCPHCGRGPELPSGKLTRSI